MAGAGDLANIALPVAAIAVFCREHWIHKLSLFGSALSDLNTAGLLSRYVRQDVIDMARVIYEREGSCLSAPQR